MFIFAEDEYETGYRLTNESDFDRVRHIDLEDDIVAINHLVRAKMKLACTEFDPELTEIITKLQHRVDQKSMKIYDKHTDIF